MLVLAKSEYEITAKQSNIDAVSNLVCMIALFYFGERAGPRLRGGRARGHARGAGCPLQPLAVPALRAGTASG
jgi:hypothetical protein